VIRQALGQIICTFFIACTIALVSVAYAIGGATSFSAGGTRYRHKQACATSESIITMQTLVLIVYNGN